MTSTPGDPSAAGLTLGVLGRAMPSGRSFANSLIRRMSMNRWNVTLESLDLDEEGRGTAIYNIAAEGHRFTFVAFSDSISEEARTERVIAQRWDVMAALADGPVDSDWIGRTREQLPFLRGGRAAPNTILWTRANRSSRFFDDLVTMLRAGAVDVPTVVQVGYALRNTGVYTNGKYGTRTFASLGENHPLGAVYHVEILGLYMLREFSFDLLRHLIGRGSDSGLPPTLQRYLGVGNGSGLGMLQYVTNHPRRFHTWVDHHLSPWRLAASQPLIAESGEFDRATTLVRRSARFYDQDSRLNPVQRSPFADSRVIANDLDRVLTALRDETRTSGLERARRSLTWGDFERQVGVGLHPESRELVRVLVGDAYDRDADPSPRLLESESTDPDAGMTVGTLRDLVAADYGWALDIDFDEPGAYDRFWYRSVEAQEPRIGRRGSWPDEFETVPSLPRRVQALQRRLDSADPGLLVGELLLSAPDLRSVIARVQGQAGRPYGEVRVNTHDQSFQPVYIIRLLLALLGMEKFQPRSEYWVQGTFFQGAPTRDDIRRGDLADWAYPVLPE